MRKKLFRSALVATMVATLAPVTVGAQAPPPPATPTCRGEVATIVGTAKGEVIKGTPGNDVIVAGGGNDIVYAGAGNDIVCGNFGADRLYGGIGWDDLNGGFGEDQLFGSHGRDRLSGGPGNDVHAGHSGNDRILGGSGNDTMRAGAGDDVAFGGVGEDSVYGGPGSDMVRGDAGDDVVFGGFGNDEVHGGAGDDQLNGGGGNDTLFPGPGGDIVDPGPGYNVCPAGCDDNDSSANPTASDDQVFTEEDTPVEHNLLDNDSDPDSDLSVTEVSDTAMGATVVVSDDGVMTYTPVGDASGTDSFTYTVGDGTDDFATATVVVTIAAVNDAPIANDDTAPTVEDQSVEIEVLANDVDVDSNLQVSSVDDSGVIPGAEVTITEASRIIYTPAPDQNGFDSFDYTVTDGELTDTATVTIEIAAQNDTPMAQDDTATTTEDTGVSIDVLANDGDIDSEPLTFDSVSASSARGGTITIGEDNQLFYNPPADATGEDTFTYTITDGEQTDSATVTVDIEAVNDAPIANDDSTFTNEDEAITIDVLANDTDVDSDLAYSTDVFETEEGGAVAINDALGLVYTPAPDYFGPDSFTYTVTDGEFTSTATVSLEIIAVNDAPIAQDDTATTNEDTGVLIGVLSNDNDVDSTLSFESLPETSARGGTITVSEDPDFVWYTPPADESGEDTFTYTITDDEETDSATVTINIEAVNDAPVANDDSAVTNEDESVTIDVLANDTDVDSDFGFSSDEFETENGGTVTFDEDLRLVYTPAPDQNGSDSFDYTVTDGELTGTATVTIEIAAQNDAPIAQDDTATTNEDIGITIDVLANDSDIDSELEFGSLPVTSARAGTITIDEENQLSYTPPTDESGEDTFTYTVTDGEFISTGIVTIDIAAVNDAPTATDDSAITFEDTRLPIRVLDNDFDIDNDSEDITIEGVSDSEQGATIEFEGDLVFYTPAADTTGEDTFTYTITDGEKTGTATVTIDIVAINDAPMANDDSIFTNEDETVTIDALTNDVDVDGDSLTYSQIAPQSEMGGYVTVNEDLQLVYTPVPDYNGPDSITYTVTDGEFTSTATVTIEINPINDAPTANDDSAIVSEDLSQTISVLENDVDVDGDDLTITGVSDSDLGATINIEDNQLIYTPPTDESGEDTFTYTVTDGEETDTATVTVDVLANNDAPVAVTDTAVTAEDVSITVDVLLNDFDVDNPTSDLSFYNWDSVSLNGEIVATEDQKLIYTPDPNFNGTDSFTYRITDGDAVGSGTVTIEVTAVNDAPTATTDLVTTDDGTAVHVNVLSNDFDVDNATSELSVTAASDTTFGGEVEILANGVVRYTPVAGIGPIAFFSYTVSDGSESTNGTVIVSINPPEEDPCLGPDENEDPNDSYNIDSDGDSCTPYNGDCDDDDPSIHPGAEDIVGDGIDQDCDGSFA